MAKKFHFAWGSVAAVCLAGVYACGDSDGGANASTNAGTAALDEVYASEDDLPGCTEKYDGAVAFVKEGSTAFKCEDGRWENKGEYYANNDAIKNCTAKREGEVAYIVDEDKSLVCEDGKWVNSSNVSSSSSWSEVKGSSSSIASSSSWTPEGGIGSSSAQAPSSGSVAQSSSSVAFSSSEESSSSSEESSSSVSSSSSDGSIYNASANTLKDLRDGLVYKTTTIDIPSKNYSEVWMAENLNFVTDNSWCGGGSGTTEGDCSVYGRLYTWAAAVGRDEDECGYGYECGLGSGDIRGACPKGWHLPSRDEWDALFTAVGGSSPAGTKLKSATGWSSSGNGTDTFGFSALPAGYRDFNGYYTNEGNDAYFWSSTELGGYGYGAYYMNLDYLDDGVYLNDYNKYNGFSVRCLKD